MSQNHDTDDLYKVRPTTLELFALLKDRDASNCNSCRSEDVYIENDPQDTDKAWLGGVISPDLRTVAPCFSAICRHCGTMRLISYDVFKTWVNADG